MVGAVAKMKKTWSGMCRGKMIWILQSISGTKQLFDSSLHVMWALETDRSPYKLKSHRQTLLRTMDGLENCTRPSISTSDEGIHTEYTLSGWASTLIIIADGAGVVVPSSYAQRSIEIFGSRNNIEYFLSGKTRSSLLVSLMVHVRNLLREFENSLTIFSITCGCHVDDLLDDSSCAPVERCEQIPLSLRRSEKRLRPRSVVHCVSSTSVSWIISTRRDVRCWCTNTLSDRMPPASLRLQSQRHASVHFSVQRACHSTLRRFSPYSPQRVFYCGGQLDDCEISVADDVCPNCTAIIFFFFFISFWAVSEGTHPWGPFFSSFFFWFVFVGFLSLLFIIWFFCFFCFWDFSVCCLYIHYLIFWDLLNFF